MTKYIAILRGINVGGHRKILMSDLKNLFENLGYQNIRTYIQSGNVIFESLYILDKLKIANQIENAITDRYGYDVPVIVMSDEELVSAIESNPFTKSYEKERLHLTFLKEIPEPELVVGINKFDFTPDKFKINNNWVFLYCAGKSSDSKMTNKFFENKLKVSSTTRNWNTVLKLAQLCEE